MNEKNEERRAEAGAELTMEDLDQVTGGLRLVTTPEENPRLKNAAPQDTPKYKGASPLSGEGI